MQNDNTSQIISKSNWLTLNSLMWYGHFRISLSAEGSTETHPVVEWNPENLRKKRGEPASEENVIYLS